MGIMKSIGWATRTWNPVTGCWGPKGTAGKPKRCFFCYAYRMAKRLRGRFGYPEDDPFRPTIHSDKLLHPLKWKNPSKVFICSMGDLFSGDIPTRYIDDILEVIEASPHHIFIVLTKRPENIEHVLYELTEDNPCRELGGGDYFPNLWMGVTCENQELADERIPILLQTAPGVVRFVSIEPMLSEIDLVPYLRPGQRFFDALSNICSNVLGETVSKVSYGKHDGLDWIIIGAMTGPGAQDHAPKKEWIESVVGQAREYNIPIFMKENLRPYWGNELIQEWPVRVNL